MNTTDFTYVLQHPQSLSAQQINAVKSIVDEFPYFQSARAIYLKGLKDKESFKYNQELKITAAYTTDRSILFDFITSEEFLQNQTSQSIKENIQHLKDIDVKEVEEITIHKSVIIDDALRQHIKDAGPALDPELFNIKVEESLYTESDPKLEITDSKITPQEKLEIGKPFNFDKNEVHSFREWLKLTRFKPIDREKEVVRDDTSQMDPKAKKFEIIDKFITANPKISPSSKGQTAHNIAKAQMIQPEALMTETLARIYVEQKNYSSAIQSYKILSLKYPEKSGFFADQIKAVKELQEQNSK
jgi:hypothetical protein